MADIDVVDLIVAKRDGHALDADDIRMLVQAHTNGDVADYQMSAFLMAAFLRGMDAAETFAMTEAMLDSGITLDLSDIPRTKVGKHSTGGVGDKISLILGPTVASCGVAVPKLSGRGLGFTGGTLDKLESLSGFRINLSTNEFTEQLKDVGLVMSGQTDEVAPADRALYALRDVTGTVESIPLIASSIMSKKLAEGTDALVLDVKCGRGAFMKDLEPARSLAETLVAIGEQFGKRTVAWITSMDTPLGRAVGNWPEVVEAIECLQGAQEPDLIEIVSTLGGEMIRLGGEASTLEEGREAASAALSSGRAFDKFIEMVDRQAGEVELAKNPHGREETQPSYEVYASASGHVHVLDALVIGRAATALGAGRARKEDDVDPLAGIVLMKKPGESVREGEPLARLYTRIEHRVDQFCSSVATAFEVRDHPSERRQPVVIERLAKDR